jgi:hypothetical protein
VNSGGSQKTRTPKPKTIRIPAAELELEFQGVEKQWFGPLFKQFLELDAYNSRCGRVGAESM